jgi:hypothetical protein
MAKPKAYVKRSALTGKARRAIPVAEKGERIVCIMEDNRRTVIISRTRLHRDSLVMVSDELPRATAIEICRLSRYLDRARAGGGEK